MNQFSNIWHELKTAEWTIEGWYEGTPFIFEDQAHVRGVFQHQKIVDCLDVRVYIAIAPFVYYSVLVGQVS